MFKNVRVSSRTTFGESSEDRQKSLLVCAYIAEMKKSGASDRRK